MNNLKSSSNKIQKILETYNLEINVIEFPQTTHTAVQAAAVIGCDVAQIAKTLIFKTKENQKAVVIIASGKNRVEEKKVAKYLGQEIEKPDADFV